MRDRSNDEAIETAATATKEKSGRKRRMYRVQRGQRTVPIPLTAMSPALAAAVQRTGKGWVSRNSPCPCGSMKRLKRCCWRRLTVKVGKQPKKEAV